MQTRDIIVIGSSLGGIEALSTLVQQFPADLPAAVFIVQHTSAASEGYLGKILSRRGALPAVTAEDGMEIRRGSIYVAPPDRHMLLTDRGVRVVFGPRENCTRPAVDPLFRTAAVHYGPRVIGVVLTGLQGDGAAGLLAVTQCGGVAIVQALDDAAHPEMPRQALAAVRSARQVSLDDLGPLLVCLSAEAAPAGPAIPETLRIEARLTEGTMGEADWSEVPGSTTELTCPDCGGPVRAIEQSGVRRYRCRVGHGFSSEVLVAAKQRAVEDALWLALRTLDERARVLDALAEDDRNSGLHHASYETRAREVRDHADKLRDLLVELTA